MTPPPLWEDEEGLDEEREVPLAWQGVRLDAVLARWDAKASRSRVQQLIEAGEVWLDGEPVRVASKRLKLGQRLRVRWVPPDAAAAFQPEAMTLPIVHEDAHLLVLNKPAGLVVHPAPGNWTGTLMNGLLAHHEAARHLPRAGIVHRLDKDTSGLMVVGKTPAAVDTLVAQIAAREVQREYLALCHGGWTSPRTVEAPIGRDPRVRTRMAVLGSGKPARTDFTPLQVGAQTSLLHCKLHTGRTHQIRVHAAHVGHPLVADALYGGRIPSGVAGVLARQALHATRLALSHPADGKLCEWRAEVPEDFRRAQQVLLGS